MTELNVPAPVREPKVPEGTVASLQSTIEGGQQRGNVWVAVTPTQVRRPNRATIRTAFQALVALAVLAPILVQAAGLDPEKLPWLAGVLAVAAGVARVMALPQVEKFLQDFLPFLAAAPPQTPRHSRERGATTSELCLIALTVITGLWFLFWLLGVRVAN